jgi:glycosyltransferase involved in cell wall biosynthesis
MSGILKQSGNQLSKIGFFSPLAGVGVDCGYGYAAVQLIQSWQRLGIPVWTSDREAPVCFNFGQPHYYEPVDGAVNIGYTPWESTGVPEAWIPKMNQMDEIWAPCQANIDWYREAGITAKLRLLPHGLNRDHYPILLRTKKEGEPFKFLHIGEPTPRKGGRIVYRVFRDLFGDRDDVSLTIKGSPKYDMVGKNVNVIDWKLSQDEMTQLYRSHHAMVYPTFGEGFGFIPFQAAATGMPTAVTNWSGPVDYMDYCFPIGVEGLVAADYEPHEGLWAKPDEDSVAMWMEYFVKSPSYFFKKSYMRAHKMTRKWSWEEVGKRAVEMMTDSLNPGA